MVRTPLFNIVFNSNVFSSYLHINPSAGSIEVGWISMSPLIQLSVMSTEAMYPIIHFILKSWAMEAKNLSLAAPRYHKLL